MTLLRGGGSYPGAHYVSTVNIKRYFYIHKRFCHHYCELLPIQLSQTTDPFDLNSFPVHSWLNDLNAVLVNIET